MRTFWFEYRGARHVIRPGETLVGRGDECTLQLDDVAVSRQHLRVRRSADLVTATDLGSSNGSFVNGAPLIGSRTLRVGDRVTLGKSELVLGARDSIESSIPPGIEILEQARMPPQATISTEPEFSSVGVLECLVATRDSAENPEQLAWMVRQSIDRLLNNAQTRGLKMGSDHTARVLDLIRELANWQSSFAEWADDAATRLSRL